VRIAIFCNEYPPRAHGGIGSFSHAYAHGLIRAGHQPTIIEMGEREGIRWDERVRIVTLERPSSPRGLGWYRVRRVVADWIDLQFRSREIDIAEIPEFEGWMPFRLRSGKIVVRLHNSQTGMADRSGGGVRYTTRWCERNTLRRHRNWISVSNFMLRVTSELFKVQPENAVTIYNPCLPIPSPSESTPGAGPNGGRYVLFVGAVRLDKGTNTLAQAAQRFLPKYPGLRVIFVGQEHPWGAKSAAESLRDSVGAELAARLEFVGRQSREDVLAWMRGAAVVALPSKFESFGMVAVEAMQANAPLVYTTAGAGPEVVENEVTGLLANPHNPVDLAGQICRLLDDPALARRLCANAAAAVGKRFSVEQCVKASTDFYRRVLAQ
jgi:glycosyltransferase involved in cell wall biosynthesis